MMDRGERRGESNVREMKSRHGSIDLHTKLTTETYLTYPTRATLIWNGFKDCFFDMVTWKECYDSFELYQRQVNAEIMRQTGTTKNDLTLFGRRRKGVKVVAKAKISRCRANLSQNNIILYKRKLESERYIFGFRWERISSLRQSSKRYLLHLLARAHIVY